jgi:hypothetical protein
LSKYTELCGLFEDAGETGPDGEEGVRVEPRLGVFGMLGKLDGGRKGIDSLREGRSFLSSLYQRNP